MDLWNWFFVRECVWVEQVSVWELWWELTKRRETVFYLFPLLQGPPERFIIIIIWWPWPSVRHREETNKRRKTRYHGTGPDQGIYWHVLVLFSWLALILRRCPCESYDQVVVGNGILGNLHYFKDVFSFCPGPFDKNPINWYRFTFCVRLPPLSIQIVYLMMFGRNNRKSWRARE